MPDRAAELAAAASGYHFFGLGSVAELLSQSRELFEKGQDLELQESSLDECYRAYIPDDSLLVQRFEDRLSRSPLDFAPL